MKKRTNFIYLLILGISSIFFMSFASAHFNITGIVYDINGNILNGSNVSVIIKNITNAMSTVSTNNTVANESGGFNLGLTSSADYGYFLTITHTNNTLKAVDFVGQSLPLFRYSEFAPLNTTNLTFYLQEAGTINITVRNASNSVTDTGWTVQIKDTRLGYPVYCSGQAGNQFMCNVPRARNYSIMVYPSGSDLHFVPVSFSWNNFSSADTYNVTDGLGNNASWYNGTSKVLHKQFNVTESFSRITGYINGSSLDILSWTEFNVVPFLLEPGSMIFMSYGTLPWNISAWRGQSDIYNLATGFYNITVPYSSAETVNYILYATAKNSSTFYGSYRNISVSANNLKVNFTMYGLLGNNNAGTNITLSNATGGNYIVNTSRQFFRLVNSTGFLSSVNAHIEVTVDYSSYNCSEFTFMEELSGSGVSNFSFPLLNVTGIKELNVFTMGSAPKSLGTRSIEQIIANNNITLSAFNPGDIGGALARSLISITIYKSNSTCDVPVPASSCILTSSTNMDSFNPLSTIIGGGKISFRMGTGSIDIHYVNVDMLASGPPDGLFENTAGISGSGSSFSAALKLGSAGPKIYDYVLVSIPYSETAGSGLNDSAQVDLSIQTFYGIGTDGNMNWTGPIWNSGNGTNASNFAGNYSHYSERASEWQTLMSGLTCGVSNPTSSSPCYIDTTNNKLWIRLPHFSGTQPSVTGSVLAAASSDSGGSSSGGGEDFWTKTTSLSESQAIAGFSKILDPTERIRISINKTYHHIGVISIDKIAKTATINVSSTPQQAVFNVGDVKMFDVTNDSYYDLQVKLEGITAVGKANVTVKLLNETIKVVAPVVQNNVNQTGDVASDSDETEESSSWIWIVVIISIVLVGIIGGIISFKKRPINYGNYKGI